MSSNLIQATPAPAPLVANGQPAPSRRSSSINPLWRVLKLLASLRLTVVLFVLSLILVFFGTVAQINNGNWTVVEEYFRSYWVRIPYQLAVQFAQIFFNVDKEFVLPGSFPFPGGWLIGTVLLVNLLAAHLVRFKLSWKRSGILLIHAGIILMMLGEFVTGKLAVEGNMIILRGQTTNYLIHPRHSELAIVDRSGPKEDRVVVIPDAFLQRGGLVQDDKLPFDLRVEKYMKNSGFPETAAQEATNLATAGVGLNEVVIERPEVSGTDKEQKFDTPSAYVTLLQKDTQQELGTYLVSTLLTGEIGDRGLQPVKVGDKSYDVGLRYRRTYKPFEVQLVNFQHKVYQQTGMARDFRSTVRVTDASQNEDFKVDIYMNHPLRYRGEAFFQAEVLKDDAGTVLQVVRNPGWLLPYFSCVIVAVGMIVHFGTALNKFLDSTNRGVKALRVA